jgi:hypothetical protein
MYEFEKNSKVGIYTENKYLYRRISTQKRLIRFWNPEKRRNSMFWYVLYRVIPFLGRRKYAASLSL